MTQLRLREGLTVRPLPGGDAVVASASGAEAVIVNTSAYALLELLTEPCTEDELAAVFVDSFPDQQPETIRRDVAELVAQLVRLEIIEPCGGAPSTV
jgi:hypothetical protein